MEKRRLEGEMKLKNLFKKIGNYMKTKQRENEKDLDFFESNLYHFLKLLYVKGGLSKEEMKKQTMFGEEKFSHFLVFAINKEYIKLYVDKNGHKYSITSDGTDFLLELGKAIKEKTHTDWIRIATIVLAISAVVSITDLLIHNTDTKNYIITTLAKIMAIVMLVFLWVIIILVVLKIIQFVINKYKNRKG